MRKYLLPLLTLLVVLGLMAAACGDDDDTTAGGGGDGGDESVDGGDDGGAAAIDGSWVLTSATVDGTDLALLDTHPITLVVAGTDMSGVAACNSYSGPFSVAGGTATFGPFSATEMACEPAESMTLEATYLNALGQANSIGLEGENLVISGETVSFTYAPQAPTEAAPLAGTNWVMDSIITGDTVSTTATTAAGTIAFADDGTVSGSTGCNNFNGTYEQADGTLTFGPLATTRKGCTDELGAQEAHVLGVLGANPAFTIEGTTLTLTAADGNGLAFTAT